MNFTHSPSDPTSSCTAGSAGCGAPVWSGANPDFLNLPYWPITNSIVKFNLSDPLAPEAFGVRFDTTRMTPLTAGGMLSSVGAGSTGPIRVSTNGFRTGLALLKVNISVTLLDTSVNPADPLA